MPRTAPITVEDKLSAYLPEIDFGVLSHGFTSYMRDYLLVVQIGGQWASPRLMGAGLGMKQTGWHDQELRRSWCCRGEPFSP